MIRIFILQLAILVSFCGGPLVVVDALEPILGPQLAVAFGFAPCGLLLLGSLALGDREHDRWTRSSISGGVLGAVLLLGMDAFGVLSLARGEHATDRGLVVVGIVTGVVTSIVYLVRTRRGLRRRVEADDGLPEVEAGGRMPVAFPRPDLDDYGLLVIALVFVVMGFVVLPKNPRVGVVTLVCFGGCAAVFAHIVVRKHRDARTRPNALEIAIDHRYPIRRGPIVTVAVGLLVLAGVITWAGDAYPPLLHALAWIVGLTGLGILVLLAVGLVGANHLELTARGLVLGTRSHRTLVPWLAIAAAQPGARYGNPLLVFWLADPDAIEVEPATARRRVLAQIASNEAWFGCHLQVMTAQFGLPLPHLFAAVDERIAAARRRASF